jgi:toxin FitB
VYVLDTNVISELRRPEKADRQVLKWAAANPLSYFFVSAISLLEIELGVQLMERKNVLQGAMLRSWMNEHVLANFAGRVLDVDTAVALRCAGLHVPDPRSDRDALIAATALVHGMTVVTRNVADFAATGVRTINPWERV